MKQRYSIRKSGHAGHLIVTWQPLDKWFAGRSYFGTRGRYVVLGHNDKPYTTYFRNPNATPLLHKGRKP